MSTKAAQEKEQDKKIMLIRQRATGATLCPAKSFQSRAGNFRSIKIKFLPFNSTPGTDATQAWLPVIVEPAEKKTAWVDMSVPMGPPSAAERARGL